MKDKIEIYIKQIELNISKEEVFQILDFLKKLVSKKIEGCESRVAILFCRLLEKIQENRFFTIDGIKSELIKAFHNIRTMVLNTIDTGELQTINLLKKLYDSWERKESITIQFKDDNDISKLLDNLEKIKFIFELKDENDLYYFPVNLFLYPLISSDDLLSDISKPEILQALMLALNIFDKNKIPKELIEIKELVANKNLRFIEYLFDGAERLYDKYWKENYEKNGTLVLYNKETSKILIRNMSFDYFKNNNLTDLYNVASVESEQNSNNKNIGYFIEYELPNGNFTSLSDEFREENDDKIWEILDIIYNLGYYNVIFPESFIILNNRLLPTNPFSINDRFSLMDENVYNYSIESVNNFLNRFNLLKIGGTGLNYINIGMISAMQKIFPTKIEKQNDTFESLLNNWISQCSDKIDSFNKFLNVFFEQLKFIYNKNTLINEDFENQFWLPLQISTAILTQLGFSPQLFQFKLYKCKLENDIFLGETKKIIKDYPGDLSEFKIKHLSDETINLQEKEYDVLLDDNEHFIYIGNEITTFVNFNNKIIEYNQKALPNDFINKIKDLEIGKIKQYMRMFEDALFEKHAKIPLDSIVRYRLIFHLLLLYDKDFDFNKWYRLIIKHDIVDFSKIDRNKLFSNTIGKLFIVKDRANQQSTFKLIYNKYFVEHAKRQNFEIYDPKITFNEKYCINESKITEICFLFDLIQDGTSTKQTLDYYFLCENENTENKKFMSFFCQNSKITIQKIMTENKISEVKIIPLFASSEGIKKIKELKYENKVLSVKDPIYSIKKKVTQTDLDTIKNIYKGLCGSIAINEYLVVRQFNQPKKNIMKDNLMDINKLVALFVFKKEK